MLYLVATPIGNLEDITLRALRILKEVDLIAAEDTRVTKILLDRYEIKKPLISYHEHSRLRKVDYLVEQLKAGKNIALVSDAGTPSISDPGGFLVEKAYEAGISVIPIPGPSALTTAVSICGFPADRFLFLGFLPKKKGRQSLLKNLGKREFSEIKMFVFYESPGRILRTLEDLKNFLGDKEIMIGRELTKKFEEILRGTISEAIVHFKEEKLRGEFVLCLKNSSK